MGLSDIKKELKKLDNENLIELIVDLCKKNKSVKEFFDFYANPDEKELFDKYRNKIHEAFSPKRRRKPKLKAGKQAISDFKNFSPSAELLADLMLYYVESGVKFTNESSHINKPLYSSLETTYRATLTLMKNEDLLGKFAFRAKKIVNDSRNIGWYFHDNLYKIHADFYAD
jgi:hypothetical protein